MEQLEELAEEGLNAVERVWRKVKDVPMNVIVFLIALVLAGIGWLSRHLTSRAGDLATPCAGDDTCQASIHSIHCPRYAPPSA